MSTTTSGSPTIVSLEEWTKRRRELLRQEKELDRQRDALSARRRELPWVRVVPEYRFASPGGPATLADLFAGHGQLIVYHFMLGPGWGEGCSGCSFVADHFDGTVAHLRARAVAFTAISSAPLDEILAFKTRMGWRFPWVSSHDTTFNRDFGVSCTAEDVASGIASYNFRPREVPMEEMPGLTVFARGEDGTIYRTYSTYARGLDLLIGTYNLLDLTPLGRNEDPEEPMSWVRHHDRYGSATNG